MTNNWGGVGLIFLASDEKAAGVFCCVVGFLAEAERLGIYVPVQDAAWENSDFYG